MKPRSTLLLRAGLMVLFWTLGFGLDAGAAQKKWSRRGVGPYTMEAAHGTFEVKLLRIEKELLWVLQRSKSGDEIETGIDLARIKNIEVPRPTLFDSAEYAEKLASIERLQGALRVFIKNHEPFRSLPGMITDEAYYWRARLFMKEQKWKQAARTFENVLDKKYLGKEQLVDAYLRTGLCFAKMNEPKKALKYLQLDHMPDDDLEFVSEAYFARGQALESVEKYKHALIHYLNLVVFYPFVNDNEVKAMEKTLPCYVALEHWQPAKETYEAMKRLYPEAPETVRATEYLREFQDKLKVALAPDAPKEVAQKTKIVVNEETEEITIEPVEDEIGGLYDDFKF